MQADGEGRGTWRRWTPRRRNRGCIAISVQCLSCRCSWIRHVLNFPAHLAITYYESTTCLMKFTNLILSSSFALNRGGPFYGASSFPAGYTLLNRTLPNHTLLYRNLLNHTLPNRTLLNRTLLNQLQESDKPYSAKPESDKT